MIILTGAAGFIGSCMLARLNEEGFQDIVLVDDFSRPDRAENYVKKQYQTLIDRTQLFEWVKGKEHLLQFVVHLGARTDTTESDWGIFDELNLAYSKQIWHLCVKHQVPLIYASSAATYGGGDQGFDDDEVLIPHLKPLNPYGQSKQLFDEWVLGQKDCPFFWAGLKFFNVYGPNEYHKGRMASVVFHAFRQIKATGRFNLFRSHKPGIKDGEQKRDFIYVKDVVDVVWFLMQTRNISGIFNLGTGQARTFRDLVVNVFEGMGAPTEINFVDTPEDIRDTYQYFTEATMGKLYEAGYQTPFTSLESGVQEYVREYLSQHGYM